MWRSKWMDVNGATPVRFLQGTEGFHTRVGLLTQNADNHAQSEAKEHAQAKIKRRTR